MESQHWTKRPLSGACCRTYQTYSINNDVETGDLQAGTHRGHSVGIGHGRHSTGGDVAGVFLRGIQV